MAAEIFIILMKKMNDPIYTQQTLEASFIKRLDLLCIREAKGDESATQEIAILINSFKFMLETAWDQKYEDKIMFICKIQAHNIKNPLTTAQAVMLRAIAPKVAPFIFSSKKYGFVFNAVYDELTLEPVHEELKHDKYRTKALLYCLAEICQSVD